MNIAFTTQFPMEGFAGLSDHNLCCPLDEADILIAAFNNPVSKTAIDKMPRLRLIANFGVGYDNIDLDACRQRGIRVTNTPYPVIEATAELCWALLHALIRRTAELDQRVRNDTIEQPGVMSNLSHSLYGLRLGIIGMGHIGTAVARRALASGLEVVYHNRKPIPVNEQPTLINYPMSDVTQAMHQLTIQNATYVSMDTLLRSSDIISLHLPYTPQVRHLLDFAQFGMMKPSAYIINTARGSLINEEALLNALTENKIRGAALDVFETEPHINPQLKNLNNVVLSPHVGTATWETRMTMCQNVTDNILAFIKGDTQQMNIVL